MVADAVDAKRNELRVKLAVKRAATGSVTVPLDEEAW